jgi:protein-disulfide isomerase
MAVAEVVQFWMGSWALGATSMVNRAKATPGPARVASGWRNTLDLVATVLMTAAGLAILVGLMSGSFTFVGKSQTATTRAVPVPRALISLDGAPRRGSSTARVALIEHSDFQCPYCAKFERETLPTLTQRYVDTGQVLFAFRNTLIPTHAEARPAAEAAVCAGMQGQFWAAHDLLFGGQDHLRQTIADVPTTLHLAAEPFSRCLAGNATARVDTDVALGKTLGITGTPTFFIGTVQTDGRVRVTSILTGARSLADFQDVLDAALRDLPVVKPNSGQ